VETTISAQKSWSKKEWGVCLFGAIAVLCAVSFYQIVNKPTSYEECVMQNVKPGDSDKGALVKAAACRKMFPNPYDIFDK